MAKAESPLTNYLAGLSSDLAPAVIEAVKEELDAIGDETFEKIREGTPVNTGALKNSLRKERIEKKGKYGTRIFYDGYNSDGVPFQLIANSLNKGGAETSFQATHHIDKAVKGLKGMDARLAKAAENAAEKAAEKAEKGA